MATRTSRWPAPSVSASFWLRASSRRQQNCGEAQEAGKVGPPPGNREEGVRRRFPARRHRCLGQRQGVRDGAILRSSARASAWSRSISKTGAVTPYPDAAWNNFSEQGDGKSEWISVQALWVDKCGPSLGARTRPLPKVDQERLPPKLVEFDLSDQPGDPAI